MTYRILRIMNRRAETQRLIAWSARKRLKGPHHAYLDRRERLDHHLRYYHHLYRSQYRCARLLHWLARAFAS